METKFRMRMNCDWMRLCQIAIRVIEILA